MHKLIKSTKLSKLTLEENITDINEFLNEMINEITFNIKNDTYKDLTKISKLFISKIKTIIDFLIKYELSCNNIIEYCYILLNMFYMMFYILIKNPE